MKLILVLKGEMAVTPSVGLNSLYGNSKLQFYCKNSGSNRMINETYYYLKIWYEAKLKFSF